MLRVVPFVQRAGGIQAFIALQAHQARLEDGGENFGAFRLAGAGRPFDEQRFFKRRRRLERGCQVVAGDEAAFGELAADALGDHGLPSGNR